MSQPEIDPTDADTNGVSESPEETPEEAVEEQRPTSVPIDLSALNVDTNHPRDLVAEFYAHVIDGIRAHRQGDKVDFAIASSVMPVNQGQFMPILALTLFIPSMEIGKHVSGTMPIQDFHLSASDVAETVRSMLETLRDARSQQAMQMGQMKAATNGLIHPGQPG